MLSNELHPNADIRVELVEDEFHNTSAVLRTWSRELGEFGLKMHYDSVDKLPQWLQTKLLKLQILPTPPPTMYVPNIGVRMAQTVYWVIPVEDEVNNITGDTPK